MKRVGLLVVLVLAVAVGAFFILTPTKEPMKFSVSAVGPSATMLIYNSGDPCNNPNVTKAQKLVAIGSATTTELVAAVAGQTVSVCAFRVTVTGTSPTLLFLTGTKVSTACDTAPANLSGTLAITSGTFVNFGGEIVVAQGAASGELCLTTGGTGPSVQGMLTYVQQ